MNEIYKIVDKIMKINHQIAGYYVKMANNEVIRDIKDQKLLQELVESKMSETKKLYIELSSKSLKKSLEDTKLIYQLSGIEDEIIDKPEYTITVDIREDILDYINDSYERMSFIPSNETGNCSIYKGTLEQIIRNTEFEIYRENMICIENREDIDKTSDITDLSYTQTSMIIEDLSANKIYDKSVKGLEKIIGKLETGEYNISNKEQELRIRKMLVYMKYNELYKKANQKENGMVVNSKYNNIIKSAQNNGSVNLVLGIDENEYTILYESIVLEGIENLKEDIRTIFRQGMQVSKNQHKEKAWAKRLKVFNLDLPKVIQKNTKDQVNEEEQEI